jgi:hypothetical protein
MCNVSQSATSIGRNLTSEAINQAKQDGIDKAGREGCDYFKQNPDLVLEIRQEVERALTSHL